MVRFFQNPAFHDPSSSTAEWSMSMKQYRSLSTILFAIVLSLFMTSCKGVQPLPVAATPQEPAPKFHLSAQGLAQTGMWKSTPLLFDINKDGHLDLLAISRLGDGAHVWLGDGTGNWTDASSGLRMKDGSCGGGMAIGDINLDGQLDLAVADHCSGVYVYLAAGPGRWQQVAEAMHPAKIKKAVEKDEDTKQFFIGSEDLALGDINGDGKPDIVTTASDMGGFATYLGDGTGKKWKEMPFNGLPDINNPEPEDEDNAGWANQVDLRDVNGDGHLDVVASYFKGPRVWIGNGKGQFSPYSDGLPSPMMGGLYRGLDVADVNGDGRLDLIVANDVNGPEVYLQQANGTWQFTGDIMPSLQNGAVGVATGDFNKDGYLDIVVAGRKFKEMGNNYGLFLLQGDGKGTWKELEATNLPQKGLSVTWGVAVGDVNEDGLLDFAAATGGAVTGTKGKGPANVPPPKAVPKKKDKEGKPETKPRPVTIEELQLPRMQVWVNEGVK
jgi:hypothetical protein